MGSGSSRKITDRPLIRVPQKKTVGSESGGSSNESVADVCLPSFDSKIEKDCKVGAKATLRNSDNGYAILVGGVTVGNLQKSLSVMVSHCEERGVVYVGIIINDNKQLYARFKRSDS